MTRFVRLSHQRKLLLFEAIWRLFWAVLQVRLTPFRVMAGRLGKSGHESPFEVPTDHATVAQDTSWAISAISRRLFKPPTCLMQAAAAKSILSRRGISATVYFGVAPGTGDGRGFNAHAWLRCGRRIVTGKSESQRYKPLAWFG